MSKLGGCGTALALGRIVGVSLLVLALAARVCAGEDPSLNVFAAASLTAAFNEIGKMMEQRHPPAKVSFSFAGSQQLAAQIEQGAKADVFASADQGWMSYLQERQLLAGPAHVFIGNRLVVALPKSNTAHVERLQDLARPGVKVVMAAEAVPVGRYSREALEKLSKDAAFGSDYASGVLGNVVSQEDNVKAVLAKIQLGEADAGIVYRSDVTGAAAAAVRVLEIPAAFNVEARYPIAIIKGTPKAAPAQTFIDLILSTDGQAALQRHGFEPLPERSRKP